MEHVIRVENLSKRYLIRHEGARGYLALRDVVMDSIRGVRHRATRWISGSRPETPEVEEFWALRNVSFEMGRGDVLGIIGRNGAGKSTLLKVLSRITEPTEGRVELNGRVASLLEVGTGFHPELTGRENIFLNGAILGMSGAEIRRKFDEIAEFAEVEKFLDTPVKRYSSGMYVRLAFSVAAHLEPDILIVDEVLAVGDGEFQKKCLGKMQEVSKGGRTVLFVSHNMGAVQALCTRAIYLDGGRVRGVGPVEELISEYVLDAKRRSGGGLKESLPITDFLTLRTCEFSPNPVESGGAVRFRIEIESSKATRLSELTLLLYTQQGYRVAVVDFRPSGLPTMLSPDRPWEIQGEITSLPLVEADYSVGLYFNAGDYIGDVNDLVSLTVSAPPANSGYAPYAAIYRGVVNLGFSVESAGPVEKTAT